MVDLTRDPRWGRVTEGAGEDPYLAAQIAAARVKGLQGRRRGDTDAVLATAKHFAGYGATVGGREYDSVDMSLRQLWETHLPPFKAALRRGRGFVHERLQRPERRAGHRPPLPAARHPQGRLGLRRRGGVRLGLDRRDGVARPCADAGRPPSWRSTPARHRHGKQRLPPAPAGAGDRKAAWTWPWWTTRCDAFCG
jgi:hypothetical protein